MWACVQAVGEGDGVGAKYGDCWEDGEGDSAGCDEGEGGSLIIVWDLVDGKSIAGADCVRDEGLVDEVEVWRFCCDWQGNGICWLDVVRGLKTGGEADGDVQGEGLGDTIRGSKCFGTPKLLGEGEESELAEDARGFFSVSEGIGIGSPTFGIDMRPKTCKPSSQQHHSSQNVVALDERETNTALRPTLSVGDSVSGVFLQAWSFSDCEIAKSAAPATFEP